MTVTIQIAHGVDDDGMQRIRNLLEAVSSRSPAWKGTRFRIERDDFTWMPDRDDPEAYQLMDLVLRASKVPD